MGVLQRLLAARLSGIDRVDIAANFWLNIAQQPFPAEGIEPTQGNTGQRGGRAQHCRHGDIEVALDLDAIDAAENALDKVGGRDHCCAFRPVSEIRKAPSALRLKSRWPSASRSSNRS